MEFACGRDSLCGLLVALHQCGACRGQSNPKVAGHGEGCVHVCSGVGDVSALDKLRKVETGRNRKISCVVFFFQFINDFVQCMEVSLLQ